MIHNLLQFFQPGQTPQSAPLLDAVTPQVRNSAGGYSWEVDAWARLDRFLILGSEGGSYYASARSLTLENASAALQCVRTDGVRTVQRVVEISEAGRAPKNDPAIFVLALALKQGDLATRRAAKAAVPRVCRIGTHLFSLAEAVKTIGGWGRGTRTAFGSWYLGKPVDEIAYQGMKYPSRNGWSHRDLLRKTHIVPSNAEMNQVFRWMVQGWQGPVPETAPDGAMGRIWAMERANRVGTVPEVVELITEHRLPRECVPTPFLRHAAVWEALLFAGRGMPMTAMLRNLGKMTAVGLLTPHSKASEFVVGRLRDANALHRSRIHPLALLVALKTYQSGQGVRGRLTWTPDQAIVDALDFGFYQSFHSVEPTGLRWMLALDVSGSMSMGRIAGLPGITPRVGSAAMALITARTEQHHVFRAFSHRMVSLNISPRQRLDDVLRLTDHLPFGGTDCALPMQHALEQKLPVDVFVIYTDSETWHGKTHPAVALQEYRQKMGIGAKLIVVGMVSNGFTIADPDDGGMLDVVGFDTAAPAILRDFAVGALV